jgi:fatty-acyl-CoA synthase
VPCMGAVMHTVNIRVSPEQIRYIVGHAEGTVLLADASLASVLAAAGGLILSVEYMARHAARGTTRADSW